MYLRAHGKGGTALTMNAKRILMLGGDYDRVIEIVRHFSLEDKLHDPGSRSAPAQSNSLSLPTVETEWFKGNQNAAGASF